MEFDTERFIDEVRKKTSLWDVSTEDYKNRLTKKADWMEICSQFHPNFERASSKQKLTICKDLQLKWRNIRDSYVRYLRSKKANAFQANKHIKTYVYAKNLAFLNAVVCPFKSESSFEMTKENVKCENVDDTDSVNEDSHPEPVIEYVQTELEEKPSLPSSTVNTSTSRRKKRRLENKSGETYPDNFQSITTAPVEDNSDDDIYFFRSLCPMLKSIPPLEKMKFRVDVMKSLLEYAQKSQPPITGSYQQPLQYNQMYQGSTSYPTNPLTGASNGSNSSVLLRPHQSRNSTAVRHGREIVELEGKILSVESPGEDSNSSNSSVPFNQAVEAAFSDNDFA